MHHHAEDDHVGYVHSKNTNKNHHCELDDYFCQDNLNSTCEHPEHLKNRLENCFTCEFHFIKHFEQTQLFEGFNNEKGLQVYSPATVKKTRAILLYICNKGPPFLG